MFCGNCGTQVADGSAVCPNCGAQMAPKSQAPQMNQSAQYQNAQYQNPQGGNMNQGAPNNAAPKKVNAKMIGIIAICVVALVAVILIVKGIFGGSGPKGTYTDGSTIVTFNKGTMTMKESGVEVSFKYKTKKDKIIVDPESMKLSDNFWEYMAESMDIDEDELEDYLEELADYSEYGEALYNAYKDDDLDDLIELLLDEMDVDEDNFTFVYDKKNNTVKNSSTKEKLYYAENYKAGPSGKYTNDEDDDLTLAFKNGTVTFDDDGDSEKFTYYVYTEKDSVYVVFYGEDFEDSDFYEDYYTTKFEYNSKKDKFEIYGEEYKK